MRKLLSLALFAVIVSAVLTETSAAATRITFVSATSLVERCCPAALRASTN